MSGESRLCISGRNVVQVRVTKVDDQLVPVVGVDLDRDRTPWIVRNVVRVDRNIRHVLRAQPLRKLVLEDRDGVEALSAVGDQLERSRLVGGRAVLSGEADKVQLRRTRRRRWRVRRGAQESYPDHRVAVIPPIRE